MKCFIACLGTETNTFSPLPTGMETFVDTMLCRGDGSAKGTHILSSPLRVWRALAEERGIEVVESLAAFAEPAGITVRGVYENLRDEILGDLDAAMPVDMVLLALHGAMVADGYPDTEGDVLSRVRAIVGSDTVVGAELDLHAHLTEAMVRQATVLVTFKEYPHTDVEERAAEVFAICLDAAQHRVVPVMSTYDCRINAYLPTTREPMRSFVERMRALEREDGVLSVSLAHGFPHGDVPDIGARTLVVTDGNSETGERMARQLGRELWNIRHEIIPHYMDMDEALDEALKTEGRPVVIADVADNAGCGAANDSTFFLDRLLGRGIRGAAISNIWDPIAVRLCKEAGEGSTFYLRVGGKIGPESGAPIDLRVTVNKIVEGAMQTFNGFPTPMGDAAWVSAEGIDLVLNTKRFQTAHPDMMTQLGLDPTARKIVIVKSTQHFFAGFEPIAAKVLYAAGPGAVNPDTTALDYKNITRPLWPLVDDPFST
jgi:microcystin degradation protein MlrC